MFVIPSNNEQLRVTLFTGLEHNLQLYSSICIAEGMCYFVCYRLCALVCSLFKYYLFHALFTHHNSIKRPIAILVIYFRTNAHDGTDTVYELILSTALTQKFIFTLLLVCCMPSCLFTCMPSCHLPVYLSYCMKMLNSTTPACPCMPSSLPAFLSSCLPICLPSYLPA
jgi:hypothetical protein